MQQIYADVDRVWASYEDIPEDLVHAAVAIEDKRFSSTRGWTGSPPPRPA